MKILKICEVIKLTRLSKTTIYNMAKEGRFPAPMKLGKRSSGFFQHEIDAWLQDCAKKRSSHYQGFKVKGGNPCT